MYKTGVPLEEKKVLLRKLINQITIYRDRIDIVLNQTLNEFMSEYKKIHKKDGLVLGFILFLV